MIETDLAHAADTSDGEVPLQDPVYPLAPKVLDDDIEAEEEDRADLQAVG